MSAETRGVESASRYDRLVIWNVSVIDGKGTPPRGPLDARGREEGCGQSPPIIKRGQGSTLDIFDSHIHISLDGTKDIIDRKHGALMAGSDLNNTCSMSNVEP
ncbi:MAG: hypothetical protein PVI11_00510 [Candidatus Aminicenantes bacterium]